ncbi:PrgI family protein [Candidatus Nomurabacteria bacterium]|nr:PrgI family protein [Candidatus Nomurabacteria bacterium]
MQFKVPQFLDIEDKIFGPFTFREFAYLAGGAGLCYILFKLLGLLFAAIPILLIAGFSGMLIFYRPNNKPFINMLESGFKYFSQNKLYIWKKKKSSSANNQPQATTDNKDQAVYGNKLTGSKLRDLAWSLDVLDLRKNQEHQL